MGNHFEGRLGCILFVERRISKHATALQFVAAECVSFGVFVFDIYEALFHTEMEKAHGV